MSEFKSQAMQRIQQQVQQYSAAARLEYAPYSMNAEYAADCGGLEQDSLVSSIGQPSVGKKRQVAAYHRISTEQEEWRRDYAHNFASDTETGATLAALHYREVQNDAFYPPAVQLGGLPQYFRPDAARNPFGVADRNPEGQYRQESPHGMPRDDRLLDDDTVVKIVTQLKHLKTENDRLKEQLYSRQRMSSELVQLNSQLQGRKQACEDAQKQIAELKEETRALKAQNESTKQQICSLNRYNENLENAKFALKGELDALRYRHENEVQELKRQHNKEIDDGRRYLDDLEARYQAKEKESEGLGEQLRQGKALIAELQDQVREAEQKLSFNVEAARKSQESRIQEQYKLVQDFAVLKRQNDALSEKNATLEKEAGAHEQETGNLKRQISILEQSKAAELGQLDSARQDTAQQLQQAYTEISKLKEQIAKQSEDFSLYLAEQRAQQSAAEATLNERERRLAELQREALASENTSSEEQNGAVELAKLTQQLQYLTAALELKNQEVEKLKKAQSPLRAAAGEKTALAQKVAEYALVIDNLMKQQQSQADSTHSSSKRDSVVEASRRQNEQLIQENLALTERVIAEQNAVLSLKSACEAEQQRVLKLRKHIRSLEAQLGEANSVEQREKLQAQTVQQQIIKQKDETIKAMNDQIAALQVSIASRQSQEARIQLLQNKLIIAEHDAKNRAKQNGADALKTKIRGLEAQINELKADNKALTKEIQLAARSRQQESTQPASQFSSNQALAVQELTDKYTALQSENQQLLFDLEQARLDLEQRQNGGEMKALVEQMNRLYKTYDQQMIAFKKEKMAEVDSLKQVILKQQRAIDDLKRLGK